MSKNKEFIDKITYTYIEFYYNIYFYIIINVGGEKDGRSSI